LGVAQPAVFHPGTWVGFLLPLPQAWSFDMTLRIFLGVLCAYLFFAGTGSSETAALLGGLAWAFSDFLMFFVGYPVTPSLAPFPLLLLALWRLSRGGGLAAAGLMTAALASWRSPAIRNVARGGGSRNRLSLLVGSAAAAGARARARPAGRGRPAFGLAAIALLPCSRLPQTHQHEFGRSFAQADRSDVPIEPPPPPVQRRALCLRLGESRSSCYAVPVGYIGSVLFP
jgi:hypothetical protein